MTKVYTPEELANLSDDELMNMAAEPVMAPVQETPAREEQEETQHQAQAEDDQEDAEEDQDEAPADKAADDLDTEDADDASAADAGDDDEAGEVSGSKSKADVPEADKKTGADKGETDTKAVEKSAEKAVDYKAAYEKIMTPFKANGKLISLESPDEAVRLMQMGANYTKKLQALQPQLRMLRMLENNGLLDEQKLSYLIDLDKKNPSAITKLVKESGIDPIDIDIEKDPDKN